MKTKNRINISKEVIKTDADYQNMLSSMVQDIKNGHLKPGDRIQSEKKMCEIYGVNVYTVRKVMIQLKKEGYLYSVPKSGVFVSEPHLADESVPVSFFPGISGDVADISFATLSCQPLQGEIWNRISRAYSEHSPISELNIQMYHTCEELVNAKADVYEYGSLYPDYYLNRSHFLDVKHYFGKISTEIAMLPDSYGIPVYYGTTFLLYNEDLLSELGFAPPVFHSFQDQMDYLETVTQAVSQHEKMRLPGSVQMPFLRLGHKFRSLFKKLIDPTISFETFTELFQESFRQSTAYWKRYRISYPKKGMENYRHFLKGETPFFFGLTADYIRLQHDSPVFKFGAMSMLNTDDTYNCIPALFVLSDDIRRTVESMRFVQSLQSPGIQKILAKIGNLPLRSSDYCHLPKTFLGKPVPERFSDCIFLTPEEYYVCINIINVELWNMILASKSLNDALEDCWKFARTYLNIALDRMTTDQRDQWLALYNS